MQSTQSRDGHKILFLDHTAQLGGGEIALLHLLEALDKSVFLPIVVLGSDGPLTKKIQDLGIDVFVLPLDPAIVATRKDTLGISALLKLKSAMALIRYSFILAKLARRLGVSLIHTNSLKSDIYGAVAGRISRIPTLWHVRDRIDEGYLPRPVVRVFRHLSKMLPSAVVANSKSTLECLNAGESAIGSVGSIASALKCVVYDGVRMETEGSEAAPSDISVNVPLPTGPVVALIGRLTHWKGQHVFIRAAVDVVRQFPSAQFWIIGSPLFGEVEYEQKLHELVQSLGLSKSVHFLGFRNDVKDLLNQVTIVVHASCLGEPFGQVVIEGMAAAKPVVATNGGALPEIITNGDTGLLVPMNDAPTMAYAIGSLLNDPEKAVSMGLRGKQHVLDTFTVTKTARSIERVYELIFARARFARDGALGANDLALKGAS